jgi:hypothetical protein
MLHVQHSSAKQKTERTRVPRRGSFGATQQAPNSSNAAGYMKKSIELYKRGKLEERVSSFISSVFPFWEYRPNNKQIRLWVQS